MSTLTHSARRPAVKHAPLQLHAAYGVCRSITRATAKNFYWSFLVLPRRKRDAICAVYAFMRHADDLSDDPQLSDEAKLEKLGEWLAALHRVDAGNATDDPVLLALSDAKHRFKIPMELLEKLVYGTTMDVRVQPGIENGAPKVLYRSFDDLYKYCYHVASVVGLVCIRIFGYRDPAAENLAERTGIAFQLTNILRDVKEDAHMGRVYLPRDDMHLFGLTIEHLQAMDAVSFKPLLKREADRAREYYKSGFALIPLLDHDSQPAMWVLVEIYSRLLEKIAAADYNVFGEKIRLTTREKLGVLAKGFWRRLKG